MLSSEQHSFQLASQYVTKREIRINTYLIAPPVNVMGLDTIDYMLGVYINLYICYIF